MSNFRTSLDKYITRGPEDDGFETFCEGVGEALPDDLWELYDGYGFMDSDLDIKWLDRLHDKADAEPDFGVAIEQAAKVLARAFRFFFVKDGVYVPEKAMRLFLQHCRVPVPDKIGLRYPPFLDPRWMNRYYGKHTTETVLQDQFGLCVAIENQIIRIEGDHDLKPGDKIQVRGEYAYRFYQLKAKDEWADKRRAIQSLIDKARKQRQRHEAQSINHPLRRLPFKWHSAIKDVLSGLSEHSAGNGRNLATVQHIRLEEDFSKGRMKRSAGDFLCTTPSGTNGKNWSNQQPEYWYDGYNMKYEAPITCKSCLKRAQKIIDNG